MSEPFPGKRAEPRRLGVREFRANITSVLRQAQRGESFLVTAHGEVVAEIHPSAMQDRPRRRPGALRGRIRMAEAFDEFPSDILAAIEGGAE